MPVDPVFVTLVIFLGFRWAAAVVGYLRHVCERRRVTASEAGSGFLWIFIPNLNRPLAGSLLKIPDVVGLCLGSGFLWLWAG